MTMSPTEQIVITLSFHLTKHPDFDMKIINRGLRVANACAMVAKSPAEFQSLMELRASQIHNESEAQLACMDV